MLTILGVQYFLSSCILPFLVSRKCIGDFPRPGSKGGINNIRNILGRNNINKLNNINNNINDNNNNIHKTKNIESLKTRKNRSLKRTFSENENSL